MASVVTVADEELLAVLWIAAASLSTRWLCRSRSGLSLVSCHVVAGFGPLLAVDEDVVDVDSGCMLIELRLMKDDVRVVERTNAVFVGGVVVLDVEFPSCVVVLFFWFWFDATPKNDSSCSRSCRAPDDSRSEARSSFRAVPLLLFVEEVVEV